MKKRNRTSQMTTEMLKNLSMKMDVHRINIEKLEATVLPDLVAVTESWWEESHE